MAEAGATISPKSVLSTRGTFRELIETVTPEVLTRLSDEIEEKLSRIPTRLNVYKYDAWGTVVKPVDLTLGTYRGGRRPIDLYWRVHAGINGVTMPASSTNLTPEEIWDLVNFMQVLPYPKMREKYGVMLELPPK